MYRQQRPVVAGLLGAVVASIAVPPRAGAEPARFVEVVLVYDGATHAFTNPEATATGEKFNLPVKYDPAADEASWKKLQELLGKTWS